MDKPATHGHPIHPLIAARWSPRAFEDREVPGSALNSVFEAARWAPSCFNEQPWNFIVARRQDGEEFERMLGCLVEGNRSWAKGAQVLMITVARMSFAHNGKPNRHAYHDLGLAVGTLSVQATELGLSLHQMAGFDADRAREVYGIPEGFEAVTAIALGYPGSPESLPDGLRDRETAPRERKPMASFVHAGRWDGPAGF
jgi:nitroreductase